MQLTFKELISSIKYPLIIKNNA